MRGLLSLSEIGVGIVKQSMIQQAADVVGSQFMKNEAILYRMSNDDAKQVFSNMMKQFYETSSVIYNKKTNEIYGCTLGCDLIQDDLDDYTEYPKSLDPIMELMDQINPRYYHALGLSEDTVQLNQIFYQVFTGVKPEMRGMRFAQRLLSHNTALAKLLGFQHIRGDFSSYLSYSVGLKIGYSKLFEIKYDQIEVNAEPRLYWKDVPKIIKEDTLYVGNLYLDNIQINLSRNSDNNNEIGIGVNNNVNNNNNIPQPNIFQQNNVNNNSVNASV